MNHVIIKDKEMSYKKDINYFKGELVHTQYGDGYVIEDNIVDFKYDDKYNIYDDLVKKDKIRVKEIIQKQEEEDKKMEEEKNKNKKGNNEDIELQKIGLKSLEDKFEEMRLKNEEMTKQIDDLTIKCNDFNIYDLFKDAKTEGGNIDLSKVLIMGLKIFNINSSDKIDDESLVISKNVTKIIRIIVIITKILTSIFILSSSFNPTI